MIYVLYHDFTTDANPITCYVKKILNLVNSWSHAT